MTAKELCYRALRHCGNMRPGYTPSPELFQDCFVELQSIYDNFNAERTTTYSQPDYIFPVTAGGHGTTGNGNSFGGTGYQIGPTALDFVGPRPVAISRMNLYFTSNSVTPQRLPMKQISMEEWMGIVQVQFTATNVANVFAYDSQFPNGVIWIWPPMIGNSLEIFTWGSLDPPTSIVSDVDAPPGYWDAFTWTLAKRVWPLCTKDVMPHKLSFPYIVGQAAIAVQRIRDVNAVTPRLVNDFSGGHRFNGAVNDLTLLLTGAPY